jgi:putative FmdB family regulatory protein
MPLYEYECKKCHHRIEKIQSFSARHIKKCPDCGGLLEQVISAPAVQFKGSGWYVTDYAKKSSAPASSSSNGDSGSKGEASSKSDSNSKGDSGSKGESGSKSESSAKSDSGSKKESKSESSSKKSDKK